MASSVRGTGPTGGGGGGSGDDGRGYRRWESAPPDEHPNHNGRGDIASSAGAATVGDAGNGSNLSGSGKRAKQPKRLTMFRRKSRSKSPPPQDMGGEQDETTPPRQQGRRGRVVMPPRDNSAVGRNLLARNPIEEELMLLMREQQQQSEEKKSGEGDYRKKPSGGSSSTETHDVNHNSRGERRRIRATLFKRTAVKEVVDEGDNDMDGSGRSGGDIGAQNSNVPPLVSSDPGSNTSASIRDRTRMTRSLFEEYVIEDEDPLRLSAGSSHNDGGEGGGGEGEGGARRLNRSTINSAVDRRPPVRDPRTERPSFNQRQADAARSQRSLEEKLRSVVDDRGGGDRNRRTSAASLSTKGTSTTSASLEEEGAMPATRVSAPPPSGRRNRRPNRSAAFDVDETRASLMSKLRETESVRLSLLGEDDGGSGGGGGSRGRMSPSREREEFRSSLVQCLREMGFDLVDIQTAITETNASSVDDAQRVVEWLGEHEGGGDVHEGGDDRSDGEDDETLYTRQTQATANTNGSCNTKSTDDSDELVQELKESLQSLGFSREDIRRSKEVYRRHTDDMSTSEFISALLEVQEEDKRRGSAASVQASPPPMPSPRRADRTPSIATATTSSTSRTMGTMVSVCNGDAMELLAASYNMTDPSSRLQPSKSSSSPGRRTRVRENDDVTTGHRSRRIEGDELVSSIDPELVASIAEMGFEAADVEGAITDLHESGVKKIDVDSVLGVLLGGECSIGSSAHSGRVDDSSRSVGRSSSLNLDSTCSSAGSRNRRDRRTVAMSRPATQGEQRGGRRRNEVEDGEGGNDDSIGTIEITPGQYAELLKGRQTWEAMHNGTAVSAPCIICTIRLQCCPEADYVLCPDCNVVSPLCADGGRGSRGSGDHVGSVGLGYHRKT